MERPKGRREDAPVPDGLDVERAFVETVRDRLGDRAAHHVSAVLPPHVRRMLAAGCDRAMVYVGRHWTVPDRRKYVTEIRNAITAKGALSIFFSWSGFNLVVFVDDRQLDRVELNETIQSEAFCAKFGVFDTREVEEVRGPHVHAILQAET